MYDEDEDDPVVEEIPVFMAKALEDQLYLIQYPLRPLHMDFDDCNIMEAKIKPGQEKIQLTIEIDTESSRYDKLVGDQMVNGGEVNYAMDLNDSFDGPLLDEYTLESVSLPENCKSRRYVIGTFREGELHLSTLKAVVQMKPTFSHLEKSNRQRKFSNAESSADTTEDDTEEEITKVTVKFSQNRGGPAKPKSYNAQKKSEEEEPWINLDYIRSSQSEFQKLFSRVDESDTPVYILSRDDYMAKLMPKYVEIDCRVPLGKRSQLNMRRRMGFEQMRALGLGDQLKAIMVNASVLTYSDIVDVLTTKLQSVCDDNSILNKLQAVAVLVHGCWVVRSDVIYPAEYISSTHGIPGPIMQRARDAILYQFVELPSGSYLDRKYLTSLTRLPNEEVTEILTKIGRWSPRRSTRPGGWEFALPFDSAFVEKYPDVFQRQKMILEMKMSNKQRNQHSSGSGNEDSRQRRRSRLSSSGETSGAGAEEERAVGGRRQRSNSSTQTQPDFTGKGNSAGAGVGVVVKIEKM